MSANLPTDQQINEWSNDSYWSGSLGEIETKAKDLKAKFDNYHANLTVGAELKSSFKGLELKEEEIDTYILHLQDILNFANIVNNAPVEGLDITIGANEAKNRFRKDEVKVFDNIEGLLQNAPEQDRHMFKIPKVLN